MKSPDAEQTEQTSPHRWRRLGEILIAAGVLDESQLKHALSIQQSNGGRLGSVLIKNKLCTEEDLRRALSEQLDVHVINLQELKIDTDVLELLPLSLIRKYEVIPLRREDRHLWVAMMDPYNLAAIDDVRFATGCSRLTIASCSETDLNTFMEERLATQSLMQEIFQDGDFYDRVLSSLGEEVDEVTNEDLTLESVQQLKIATEQPPIVSFCNFLMVQAFLKRASDLHVEPYETY